MERAVHRGRDPRCHLSFPPINRLKLKQREQRCPYDDELVARKVYTRATHSNVVSAKPTIEEEKMRLTRAGFQNRTRGTAASEA